MTRILATLTLFALAGQQDPDRVDFPRFTDLAAELGVTVLNRSGNRSADYIVDMVGSGAALFDYDNDGDPDLLIANGSTLERHASGGDPMAALYENRGGRFVDVTADAGVDAMGWGMGVCAADYDNDGYRDFYLTAYGANVLYRNNGDGTFTDRTSAAGVGDTRWGTNCAFGDYDRDGDVDLYVANYVSFDTGEVRPRGCSYMGIDVLCGPRGLPGEADVLYRNEGDGTFRDVTREAGIEDPGYYGFGVVFSDLDGDGWPDIYVANDSVPNFLFHNQGDGRFAEIALLSGTAVNSSGHAQAGMGLAVGDVDGDGLFDIYVTNFARDTNTLYRNRGNMLFEDATARTGGARSSFRNLGWGTGLEDLDNDGYPDIFVANGHVYPGIDEAVEGEQYHQAKEIYHNLGRGTFRAVAPAAGGDLARNVSARGTAFGDYDNDGDIDILVVNINARPSFYRNESANENHWVTFRLEGTESNRDAIGARVEITAGGRTQTAEVRSGGSYLSHNDLRVHFGLGETTLVDRVRIRWPAGTVEEFGPVEVDRFVTVREGNAASSSARRQSAPTR